MPRFNEDLLNYFKASDGAFSRVTRREAGGDKSVTIDAQEKSVLFKIYEKDTFHRAGGSDADGLSHEKLFNIYNPADQTSVSHSLSIQYPKRDGNELRLYFRRSTNFYPTDTDVWFIFTRQADNTPFIGFMDARLWHNISSGTRSKVTYETSYLLDDEDDAFQKAIQDPTLNELILDNKKEPEQPNQYLVTAHKRNAKLAAQAAIQSNYNCEFDNSHESFTSGATGKPYVEVHHLIPISQSKNFNVSLDISENLIVLCPNCHRKIHFSEDETKKAIVRKFFNERKEILSDSGIEITLGDLLNMYGV